MRVAPIVLALLLARPPDGDACGAFIARTDGLRFNDALQFVVFRDGTRTVVSVQNTYRGPVEDFALLVPVPAVLHEGDVKTLDRSVFDAFEGLTGPLLTALAETDPCAPEDLSDKAAAAPTGGQGGNGVRVEAQFAVGEYDVAVLSATQSTALDGWLRDNGYAIPPALATQLRPYIEEGSKFFVAKVDPKRLGFTNGTARLSPLRFEYDAAELRLPLRLSAATSPGVQDVIIYAVARSNTAFEAANRPNLTIPSELDITDAAAAQFAAFYATLFARTLDKRPDTVVTEYRGEAWSLPAAALEAVGAGDNKDGLTVTRLHLQVHRDGALDDLVLRATPIQSWFHAQYYRKTRYAGAIECTSPHRERWQAGVVPASTRATPPNLPPLEQLLESDIPLLGLHAASRPTPPPPTAKKSGCGCGTTDPCAPLGLAVLALVLRRRPAP
jgi:hypothetical protein